MKKASLQQQIEQAHKRDNDPEFVKLSDEVVEAYNKAREKAFKDKLEKL